MHIQVSAYINYIYAYGRKARKTYWCRPYHECKRRTVLYRRMILKIRYGRTEWGVSLVIEMLRILKWFKIILFYSLFIIACAFIIFDVSVMFKHVFSGITGVLKKNSVFLNIFNNQQAENGLHAICSLIVASKSNIYRVFIKYCVFP